MKKLIDGIEFELKEDYDFGFLGKFGKVFKVFDQQSSGNICFGIQGEVERLFVKFAGAPAINYEGNIEDAIVNLQKTHTIYTKIKHPNLIEYLSSEHIGNGFAVVFRWIDAVCLGRAYPKSHQQIMSLPNETKELILKDIFNFVDFINQLGYVAVDFYDGSIMFDSNTNKTIICDIDYFELKPYFNNVGRMMGSSRFMSIEEFTLGSPIDEVTNVLNLGKMALFLLAGSSTELSKWPLSKNRHSIIMKAISKDRTDRYQSISELIKLWDMN